MTTQRVNGLFLELYDSISELPVGRFQEYNRFVMIDAGIGSDLESIDTHIAAILRQIRSGNATDAERQLLNLRQNMAFVVSKASPKMSAFVALIKSINGRPVEDLSEEGVNRVLSLLNKKGFTLEKLEGLFMAVKKKLEAELEVFFPSLTDSAEVKEYYSELQRRVVLLLQLIQGKDTSKQIEEIDNRLLNSLKPQQYDGNKGLEVQFIKAFERTAVLLSQKIGRNAKDLTVLEYFEALEIVKEQAKAAKKGSRPTPAR